MMKKRAVFIKILSVFAVLGLIFAAIIIYLKSLQKETCKFTIEYSLAVFANKNEVRLATQFDGNWKELSATERRQLLEKLKEREKDYTECPDYSYLLKGQDAGGAELQLFARKGQSGLLEMRLGK